jgi:hypothetical protein
MTTLLALGCLGLAAWALWERAKCHAAEQDGAEWQFCAAAARADLLAAQERIKDLKAELAEAQRNDRRDAKGRYCKPEEVH